MSIESQHRKLIKLLIFVKQFSKAFFNTSNEVEQKHTKENIRLYGYENVRGGKYTNSKTLKKQKANP